MLTTSEKTKNVWWSVTGLDSTWYNRCDSCFWRSHMKHGKNHVSEMFPAKKRHISQKFQKGFKTLPSAHPDEAFVQPALHPAQWLHHAPAREGTPLRSPGSQGSRGATCVTPPSRLSTVFRSTARSTAAKTRFPTKSVASRAAPSPA